MGIYDSKKDRGIYDNYKAEDIPTITIPVEDYLKLLEGKQEPQTFRWCTGCREYDQEKHCCHRWSKIIRDTVEEMKQEPKTGHWIANAPQYDMLNPQYICSECGNAHTRTTPYCEMCGAKMVEPQESEGI